MSLANSLTGYIDFKANQWKQDPEAKKYMNDKAATDAAATAAAAAEQKKKDDDAAAAAAAEAAVAAEKEKHFDIWRFISTLTWTITIAGGILVVAALAIASGSILANHGVELPVLLRIFYFIYGALFFFVYIPFYYIVEVGVYKNPVKIRAVLPVKSTPFTWSWLNRLLGWMIIDGVPAGGASAPGVLTAMATALHPTGGPPAALTAIAGVLNPASGAPAALTAIASALHPASGT